MSRFGFGFGNTQASPKFIGSVNAPSSTTVEVTVTGIAGTSLYEYIQLSAIDPVDITSNPQIANGIDNQIITIIGGSDTNTVTFQNGDGLKLSAESIVLGKRDILTLRYNAEDTTWYELYKNN